MNHSETSLTDNDYVCKRFFDLCLRWDGFESVNPKISPKLFEKMMRYYIEKDPQLVFRNSKLLEGKSYCLELGDFKGNNYIPLGVPSHLNKKGKPKEIKDYLELSQRERRGGGTVMT